jgi:peptidylprolyl isomerase/peptidyl-prolyl cis-trans isomerase A (cyclophilin A)
VAGKRRRALLLLALALGVVTLAGCGGGGGSSGPTVIPGTPTGTHSISVSATSGSLQRGVNIELVVQ